MSSGKRFEKTFTRNRKKNDSTTTTTKHDDVVPTTTTTSTPPPPPSYCHHQQNGQSHHPNTNNGKSNVAKKPQQSTTHNNNNNNNNNKTDSKPNKQKNTNNNNSNKSNDDENKDKKKSKKKNKNASGLEKLKQRIQNEDDKDEPHIHKRKLENRVDERESYGVLKKEKKQPKTNKKENSTECVFPTNRIFRIVKSESSSDSKLSGEAVFLINKATENFVELFSKDAYEFAREDQKSFVGYKHLASAVCKKKRFDFLADCVPEKVTAEKALAERNPAETLPV